MNRIRMTLAALTAVMLPCGVAQAAPYTFDENLKPLSLELADYPGREGVRWAAAEGILGSPVDHIAIEGLSSLSATEVFLLAFKPGTELTMSIAKFTWNETLRSCATDADGFCSIGFRTHADAGIRIEGAPGTAWRLFVLTSPKLGTDAVMPSPLVSAEELGDESSVTAQDSGGFPWLAAVAILAVAAVVAVLLLRKRSPGIAPALLGFAVTSLLVAGAVNAQNPATPYGENNRNALTDLDEALSEARLEESRSEIARRVREGERIEALQSRLQGFAGHINTVLSLFEALDEFTEAYTSLDSCSNVSNPAGMPSVPSFCADDAGCSTCFSQARGDFDRVRGTLEELRVIYTCTKNMTDKAIALGDTGSNVHAVTGLAWQAEKRKIEASVKNLQSAYDNKYLELMGSLQNSMLDIGRCEAEFGQPDWYDRFGYVYFEFMKDKYKRSD